MKPRPLDTKTEAGEEITPAECRRGFRALVRYRESEFGAFLRGGVACPEPRSGLPARIRWGEVKLVKKL